MATTTDMKTGQKTNGTGGRTTDEPHKQIGAGGVDGQQEPATTEDALYTKLVSKLGVDLDDEVQYELARLLSIVEEARSKSLAALEREAEAAIWALVRKAPKLQFARTIRYRLEMELLRNNGKATRYLVSFTNGNPVAIVGVGVLITLLAGLFGHPALGWMFGHELIADTFLLEGKHVNLVAVAAFFGGVVSVLSRFREFSKLRDFDPIFVFSNGLLKPYVGVLFAMFVYAFLASEFVPAVKVPDDGANAANLWWAVGFLAGFSERFTKDIISRSEHILGGHKGRS